jgi:hypothetical protein
VARGAKCRYSKIIGSRPAASRIATVLIGWFIKRDSTGATTSVIYRFQERSALSIGRHGSVNETDTPALWAVRTHGVPFENNHWLFPTSTTANASPTAATPDLGQR